MTKQKSNKDIKIRPKEGQIVCKLSIETEYRKYNYIVESGQEINFIDLSGKKIKIKPEITYREFTKGSGV